MTNLDALARYEFLCNVRDIAFSRLVRKSFGAFGNGSRLTPPLQVEGAARISIGCNVHIRSNTWLLTLREDARLEIDDGASIMGFCVLSAAASVRLGRDVLLARNVYISDHSHGKRSASVPIKDQPLDGVAPVDVGDGAWLGQNVVVLPGVRIGAGAVVGANSVVGDNVPARTVAVGSPARIVNEIPTS